MGSSDYSPDFKKLVSSYDGNIPMNTRNLKRWSDKLNIASKDNINFMVAHNPNITMIEEEPNDDQSSRPINYAARPNGQGQKANSFHVPSRRELETNVPTDIMNKSCRPDLTLQNKYFLDPNVPFPAYYKRRYEGPIYAGTIASATAERKPSKKMIQIMRQSFKRQNSMRPKNNSMRPESVRPNVMQPKRMAPIKNSGSNGIMSQRKDLQQDISFASEPNDSFEALEAQCNADDKKEPMQPQTSPPVKKIGGDSGFSFSLRDSMQQDRSFAAEPDDSFEALEAQCRAELEQTNSLNSSSIEKPLLNSTPKSVQFATSPTVTMMDSGCGVSTHQSNSQNNSTVTLRIITPSNVPTSPCCKDAQGKLNHVAAINAKKVDSFSKVVHRKAQEFKSMLAENIKLAQNNYKLTELSKAADDKWLHQQTTTNELEAKHLELVKKFEGVQQKLDQLEKEGFRFDRKATDDLIDRLIRNYDRMFDESEKQNQQINELTDILELMEQDNNDLSAKMTEMGLEVTSTLAEKSQNDSILQSMADENSILEEHSSLYHERSVNLENSITRLGSRVENLSALSEGLATKNRDLSMEVSQLEKSSTTNADQTVGKYEISADDTRLSVSSQNKTADDSMEKYVEFCEGVAEELQAVVNQQDMRIHELETTISEAPYKAKRRSV